MAGSADPRIDDHRHYRLLDDNGELMARLEAPVAPDRRTERHDRRGTRFLKSFCQDRISIDVGKNREPFGHQHLGRLQGLNGIGKQVAGVRMNLELHPLRQTCGGRETRQTKRLLGGVGAARVGK